MPAERSVRFVNLTPHDPIRITTEGGRELEIPATRPPARCDERSEPLPPIRSAAGPVPARRIGYGQVHGLPDPEPGTICLVSQLVARALPGRDDLFYPTDLVRDESGDVIECRALARPEPGGRT